MLKRTALLATAALMSPFANAAPRETAFDSASLDSGFSYANAWTGYSATAPEMQARVDWDRVAYLAYIDVGYLAVQIKDKDGKKSNAEIAAMGSDLFVKRAIELMASSSLPPTNSDITNIELPRISEKSKDPGYYLICAVLMKVAAEDGGFPDLILNKDVEAGGEKYDLENLAKYARTQSEKQNMRDVVAALAISCVWPAEASLNWCLRAMPKPSTGDLKEKWAEEKDALMDVLAGKKPVSSLAGTDRNPRQIAATVLLGGSIEREGVTLNFKGLPKGAAASVFGSFMDMIQKHGESILNARPESAMMPGDKRGLHF